MSKRDIGALRALFMRIGLFILLSYLLLTFVFGFHRMRGISMFPNLKDGDLLVLFLPGGYSDGDVVCYKDDSGAKRMGRVVAVPGDDISIRNEMIVVNGIARSEEIMYPTYGSEETVELGPGEYYLLNDYRLDEDDSRSAGAVRSEDIYGRLIFILRRRGF